MNAAYRGQHVAKALYRAALGVAVSEEKRIYSAPQRTAATEGMCRRLETLGRARPIPDARPGEVIKTEDNTESLPQPELDARGKPCWPVRQWWLDPYTTDVEQLNQDSPI